MQKRILAVLLSVAMLLGIGSMVGCGGVNTSNVVTVESFDRNTEVEISFTHTMGQNLQKVLDNYIAEFNKIYPNIHITHKSAGGWGDIAGQINTEIAADSTPNIAYCYPDHVAMYNIAKSVVVLDNLIDSDVKISGLEGTEYEGEIVGLTQAQKDDFVKSYYNEGLVYGDNLMYTMPLSKSTEVLYYNKTVFEENGWEVPTTWDEMWALCAKIKEKYPQHYPLGYDSEANLFITLCEQMQTDFTSAENGGQILFNNAENKAMVKKLREYYSKGYFTTEVLYGAYTSNLFVETEDQRSFMCIGSSGGASYQMSSNDTADGSFAFEVGVAPIPQFDPNHKRTISQGPSLCIMKNVNTTDEQVIASWLFVKFLCTSVDFQAEFSMTSGYMPVLNSVTEHPAYKSWLDKANGKEYLVAQCVKVGIEGRDNYFVSPAFNGSTKAREQAEALMVACLATKKNSDAEVDALIDEEFKNAVNRCK